MAGNTSVAAPLSMSPSAREMSSGTLTRGLKEDASATRFGQRREADSQAAASVSPLTRMVSPLLLEEIDASMT